MWDTIPNPGRIKIYTSGCPKNQNRCWYKIGSPPPAGSKKAVFRFRSVKSMVIAPARTGRDKSNKIAVKNTDQTNKGVRSQVIPAERMLIMVVIKLTAPRIELAPAKCKLKIERSTEAPAWAIPAERGGYTVHPVPAPLSTNPPLNNKMREGGKSQKLMLFIRGNAISGAPIIKGTNQFPNPPIIIGITMKKIIIKAWAVTATL